MMNTCPHFYHRCLRLPQNPVLPLLRVSKQWYRHIYINDLLQPKLRFCHVSCAYKVGKKHPKSKVVQPNANFQLGTTLHLTHVDEGRYGDGKPHELRLLEKDFKNLMKTSDMFHKWLKGNLMPEPSVESVVDVKADQLGDKTYSSFRLVQTYPFGDVQELYDNWAAYWITPPY